MLREMRGQAYQIVQEGFGVARSPQRFAGRAPVGGLAALEGSRGSECGSGEDDGSKSELHGELKEK